jgi:hypothetical protein
MTRNVPPAEAARTASTLPLAIYDSKNASRDGAEPSSAGVRMSCWANAVVYPKTKTDGYPNRLIHQTDLRGGSAGRIRVSQSARDLLSVPKNQRIHTANHCLKSRLLWSDMSAFAQDLLRPMGCSLEAQQPLAVARTMSDIRPCRCLPVLSLSCFFSLFFLRGWFSAFESKKCGKTQSRSTSDTMQ